MESKPYWTGIWLLTRQFVWVQVPPAPPIYVVVFIKVSEETDFAVWLQWNGKQKHTTKNQLVLRLQFIKCRSSSTGLEQ